MHMDVASFGYNASGSAHSASGSAHSASGSAHSVQEAGKLQKAVGYLNIVHKVALVASIVLGFAISWPIGIAVAVAASALYYGFKFYAQSVLSQTAGIVVHNPLQFKTFRLKPTKGECSALPTEHGADTELWREKLIAAAQENIVISGNYCGGTSFNRFLNLIAKRMQEKEALKVVVISSPKFLKENNLRKIAALKEAYPDRFSLVESPEILHVGPGLKIATNHTKCMVIDYGRYFILGGSGIKDNFIETGLDDLSKEAFLQARNPEGPPQEAPEEDDSILAPLLPGIFRDMDFVFASKSGKNPVGRQVFGQALLLAHRWEQYQKIIAGQEAANADVANLGLFSGKATPITAQDTVTMRLLKTPVPVWKKITTKVEEFDSSPNKAQRVAFSVFASGPEQSKSIFANQLIERINKAKERIVTNHMYFHPSEEILQALVRAAARGVKIKIITCGVYENCPKSHYVFGPRNKYNYARLIDLVASDKRENIEIFEFRQHKKGNHKKAIVIDDYVIGGSSNLGYKSLLPMSDHELNFVARSKMFAQETLKIFDVDQAHSAHIEDFSLSYPEYFKAGLHRILAPLIG